MSTKELGFMGNGDWEMWEGGLLLGRRRDHQSRVEESGQGWSVVSATRQAWSQNAYLVLGDLCLGDLGEMLHWSSSWVARTDLE